MNLCGVRMTDCVTSLLFISHIFVRFLMGRDKSRAHLHVAHRTDSNAEQQLEALRQKLTEVGMKLHVHTRLSF